MRRFALAVSLVVALAAVKAHAEDLPGPPAGGGGISQDTIFVGIIAPGQTGSSGPVSADSPAAPRPYTYTWVPLPPPPVPTGAACVDPFGGIGAWFALVVRDLSGAMVATEPRCVP